MSVRQPRLAFDDDIAAFLVLSVLLHDTVVWGQVYLTVVD